MSKFDDIKNVLVVDDDANITFLTQLGLEGLTDWHIQIAGSGEEALEKVKECTPDLVLLDIMMPGMDGLSTFAALRNNPALAATHIIFVTAKVQRQEIDQYLDVGVDGVIIKPFDPIRLPENIEGIIRKATALAGEKQCAAAIDNK